MPTTKSIFFVNKTADSKTLTQSDGIERSRIFSHVQRAASTRKSELTLNLLHSRSLESPKESKPCEDVTLAVTRVAPNHPRQSRLERVQMPSPLNDLRLNSQLSQFHSYTIPVSWYFNALTGFYSSPMVLRVFPARNMAGESQRHTLTTLSHDILLRNSLLCTAATAMYIESDNKRHKTSSIYFKGEAISQLKIQIARGASGSSIAPSIYAVALLLWAECLHGNSAHILAHMAGLKQMIVTVGGLKSSPLPAAAGIVACSYLCSAMMRTAPTLSPTLLKDARISKATWITLRRCPGLDLKPMTSRFFTTSNANVIGPTLLGLIPEQYSCILFKELCLRDRLEPSHNDAQSIFIKQLTAEHALLSLPFDKDQAPLNPAQEAVRLALYVFSQPVVSMFSRPSFAFTRSMSCQMKDALEDSDLSELWAPASDLLLWILFICAHISRGQSEWVWITDLVKKLIEELGLKRIEDLQQTLEGFYYFPTHYGSTLRELWGDVTEGQD